MDAVKGRFLVMALLLSVAASQAVASDKLAAQRDLARLTERNLISDPEYWREHLLAESRCDGAKVGALLEDLAKAFKPAATIAEAIEVLVQRSVISSPDYWTKHAVAGQMCEAKNVAALLNRVARSLPLPPPKSAQAAPLEATPAASLKESYEVIVAGAGTGGVGAAVQAARMGRSVLLVEETDWIGGQMNAAAVTSMDEGSWDVRDRGLYRELCGLIASHYQPLRIRYLTAYWNGSVCTEPRVGRRLLHVLLGDARGSGTLDLALRGRVIKVSKSGDVVTGVAIETAAPAGRSTRTIACKVLVDATEWGDVIPLTGARYRVGNCTNDAIDPSRHVQDNTWTAVIKQYPRGVPAELLVRQAPPGYTDQVHAAFVRSLSVGEKIDAKARPWSFATFIGYRGMPDSSRPGDSPPITRTHMNYNNDFHATVAEIEDPARRLDTGRAMRLKTLHLLYYLQHTLGKTDWSVANDEGYDTPYNRAQTDAWLAERPDLVPYRAILDHFSVIPYVRESRRIVGVHTLVAREIERAAGKPIQFAHSVAIGDYPLDLHGSATKPYLEMDLDRECDIPREWGKGSGPFAIPFECFIPEKIDGFLPAEKNLSQTRLVNGATRLQPSTLLMGQAVGAIAALAIERHIQPRALDPLLVQKVLLDAGCTLAIQPVMAPWGTAQWKAEQLELLRQGQATGR